MKWLQDNPVGMVLAGLTGFLALLALGMSILWTLPETAEISDSGKPESGSIATALVAHQVADMSEFEVINQKPVFNESRLPVLVLNEDGEGQEDVSVEIKDAPDVRLTGVIITPSLRIASLTPADGNLKAVMAHEGQALTGEFVGWHVSSVSPRIVVLESRSGEKLDLQLQVYDTKIKEPPKPVAETKPEPEQVNEDGQPMSRADQIRQRIAERREELRREQEEQQFEAEFEAGVETAVNATSNTAKTQNYQSAIRAMMRNKSKDKSSDDNKDE